MFRSYINWKNVNESGYNGWIICNSQSYIKVLLSEMEGSHMTTPFTSNSIPS
jgi:hypothetical protein